MNYLQRVRGPKPQFGARALAMRRFFADGGGECSRRAKEAARPDWVLPLDFPQLPEVDFCQRPSEEAVPPVSGLERLTYRWIREWRWFWGLSLLTL